MAGSSVVVGAKVSYINQSGQSCTGVVLELARLSDGTPIAKVKTDSGTYSMPVAALTLA